MRKFDCFFQLLCSLTNFSNNSRSWPGISMTCDPFLYILKDGRDVTPSDFAKQVWSSISTLRKLTDGNLVQICSICCKACLLLSLLQKRTTDIPGEVTKCLNRSLLDMNAKLEPNCKSLVDSPRCFFSWTWASNKARPTSSSADFPLINSS
uniref:Uncharacterized protein n=1 Tax=Rhizophora mucronata TaxID=61149 RepID=A0A2P2IMQ9_RHIMU